MWNAIRGAARALERKVRDGGSSENPLTVEHWLGFVDARPVALFRIAIGLVMLHELSFKALEIGTFFVDDGVLPRAASGRGWTLFHLAGTSVGAGLLVFLTAVATLSFTLGFHTRIATVLTWLCFVALHHRTPPLGTAGDSVEDILLFFGIFGDLSGRFSLDSRSAARETVRALPVRIMQYLPALMYLYSARTKLMGSGGDAWLGGPIVYQHLHLSGWVRPAGAWLREHPSLCSTLAFLIIAIELLIPLLLVLPSWIKQARAGAVVLHSAFLFGIFVALKAGSFTPVMFAVTLLWVLPEWLDKLGGWARGVPGTRFAGAWGIREGTLVASLSILCFFVAAAPVVSRHLPMFVHQFVSVAGLGLPSGTLTRAESSKRWEARGVVADGRSVDPLPVAAPQADFSESFADNLWAQLPYRLQDLQALGSFVCRRYNETSTGSRLDAWTLTLVVRPPPVALGAPPGREEREPLLKHDCP